MRRWPSSRASGLGRGAHGDGEAGAAPPRERALIEALSKRLAENPAAPRPPLDRAYADAMADVASRFRDDPDVQVFDADAVMNTMA